MKNTNIPKTIKNSSLLGIRFDNWVIDTTFLPIFIFVFVVPVTYIEINQNFSIGLFALWFVEKIIVWSACFIFWRMVEMELEKNLVRKINFLQLCLIGITGGLIITSLGALFIYAFKLQTDVGIGTRFITTSYISSAVIICTSILGRKRREYALRRKSFRKTSIQSKFLELKKDKSFKLGMINYESQIRNNLLAKIKFSNENFSVYECMEEVREYSHNLTLQIKKEIRKNKFKNFQQNVFQEFRFIFYSFKRQALRPGVFAVVISIIFGFPLIRHSYQPISFFITAIYFFITYSIHHIQKRMMQGTKDSISLSVLFNTLNIFLLVFVDSMFYIKYPDLFQHTIFSLRLLFLFMTYLFFCFAGHLAQASSMLEEYLLLSDLVAENESKYASIVRNQLQDNLALKWSNYLHNEIQSRLLAIVLSDKRRLIKSKLEDINSRIEKKSFIDEVGRYPRSSLISKNLDYLQNLWRSIITIDFKLDRKLSEVELNQTIVIEILEVVNELIANAVRHGEATRIEFSIESRSNNRYFISAVNNGLPYRVSKKGLGSVLLDEIAPSNWSIRNSGKLVKTELILIENKKSI